MTLNWFPSDRRFLHRIGRPPPILPPEPPRFHLGVHAKQAKDRELETWAAEIRIRAERKLGELIQKQKETVGLNKGGWTERDAKSRGSNEEPQERAPTLAEAGIDKKLSARSQKTAAVPEAIRWQKTLDNSEGNSARVSGWPLSARRQGLSIRLSIIGTNVGACWREGASTPCPPLATE